MSRIGLLVIGGSAGSLDVLMQIIPNLRSDISFPVIIVLHRKKDIESTLEGVLNATNKSVNVKEIEDKEKLNAGVIYIAPADYHVLVEKDGTVSLDVSERIHFCRPSIDVTFESAALGYGSGAAGIILSGANHDGAKGLKMILDKGGVVCIQDPEDAAVSYMPLHAVKSVRSGHILPAHKLADFINSL